MKKTVSPPNFCAAAASYLFLLIFWSAYRLFGQQMLYAALPALPAVLAESAVKLVLYGAPVLLVVVSKRELLETPPGRWFQFHKDSFTAGLGGGLFFLAFFLLADLMKNGVQGFQTASPRPEQVISTVLVAGITEELFFRGLLLNLLVKVLPFGKGNLLTAAGFMLIHFPSWIASGTMGPFQMAAGALSVFAVGLLLGWVFEKPRDLWGPIFFHSLYNLGVILFAP